MKLHPEWRKITRKAWSMRLMALATALSAVESVLPNFSDAIPRGSFAILTVVVSMGAMFARVLSQGGDD